MGPDFIGRTQQQTIYEVLSPVQREKYAATMA